MMKAPTNSDTRAKATSTVLKVLMACSKMSWFSLVNAAPVMASVWGGSPAASTRRTRADCDTPGRAASATKSNLPGWATRAWAVGVSSRAALAPL